jgi:hypothetical protein
MVHELSVQGSELDFAVMKQLVRLSPATSAARRAEACVGRERAVPDAGPRDACVHADAGSDAPAPGGRARLPRTASPRRKRHARGCDCTWPRARPVVISLLNRPAYQRTRALLRETHANVKTRVYPDAGHAMFYDSYQVEQDLITFLWGVMPPNLVAQDDRIYGE